MKRTFKNISTRSVKLKKLTTYQILCIRHSNDEIKHYSHTKPILQSDVQSPVRPKIN